MSATHLPNIRRVERTAQQWVHQLARRRLNAGISRKKLAELTGIHESTIRRYEAGKLLPSLVNYLNIDLTLEDYEG